MQTFANLSDKESHFPPFSLNRLLATVFAPKIGENVCVLIDLDDPADVKSFAFLKNPRYSVQKKAYDIFYQGILTSTLRQMKLAKCDFFAYKKTGGSNLQLPDIAYAPDGSIHRIESDIYPIYDIILCVTDYSATAPLTAAAKKYGFRGATMHGLNDTVLKSGLSVDYNDISRKTEMLRKGMTQADSADIDFEVGGQHYHLHVELGKQEAQKSHGICHEGPDVVNLPAGEVYFVPVDANGSFPIKFEEDGTLGLMRVEQGKVVDVTLIRGNQEVVEKYRDKFTSDPASGILGELGFGTQVLPYSGADIQDEKIFGTFHLATGRNDHLSGSVTIDRFFDWRNATHDDILFSSAKTPEIHVKRVSMQRGGSRQILIEDYEPSEYLRGLLKGS